VAATRQRTGTSRMALRGTKVETTRAISLPVDWPKRKVQVTGRAGDHTDRTLGPRFGGSIVEDGHFRPCSAFPNASANVVP